MDWRANDPILMAIGPVSHPDDAVANKMSALYGRAFAQYGITGQNLDEMLNRFAAWRHDLLTESSPE